MGWVGWQDRSFVSERHVLAICAVILLCIFVGGEGVSFFHRGLAAAMPGGRQQHRQRLGWPNDAFTCRNL